MQRLGTWRRDLATKCYWQLVERKLEWAAHYAEALQFVRWRALPRVLACGTGMALPPARARAQARPGGGAPAGAGDGLHRRAAAPIAQRDLPQLIAGVVEQPMTMVQAWYDHAMVEFHNAAAAKPKGFGGSRRRGR